MISFTGVYMSVALAACIYFRNPEFIIYSAVMAVLITAVTAVHLRTYLHIATRWGLSIWGLLHMAGGLVPIPATWPRDGDAAVLYNLWLIPHLLKYDQIVHAYGSGLVTWSCWQAMQGAFHRRGVTAQASSGLLLLCLAAGIGFGAANETIEFIATLILPQTNVGDCANTGWDMISNLVGVTFATAIIWIKTRYR